MKGVLTIKILRYQSLLIIGILLTLMILFVSAMFHVKGHTFILIAAIYLALLLVSRYFCSGKFSAQETDNNRLIIKWIRKPLFSDEKDFEIDLFDISELKVFNDFISHTPDEFYLRTHSGKSLTFHIPIIGLGNQFNRFFGILQGAKQISDMKNKETGYNKL